MKHKRVLSVVLALMMVVAFMPTLTFAESAAAEDEVTCTVTVAGTTQTIEKNSIEEAIEAVNDGGTITVVGTINNNVMIDAEKDFTLDLTGATLAEGVKVAVPNPDGYCLVQKGKIYSYHERHDFDHAEAVPTVKDPSKAVVTVYCNNGHSFNLRNAVEGEEVKRTDTTITYEAEITLGDWYVDTVTWQVPVQAEEDVYELLEGTVDYIQDDTGMAVKDKDGKVQFTAKYSKNHRMALDDKGDPIVLNGSIVKRTEVQKATAYKVGIADYDVEFTLPDDTKAKVTVEDVIDTPKKDVDEKDELVAIEFLCGGDWKRVEWVDNTTPIEFPEGFEPGKTGTFSYRLIWTDAEEEGEYVVDPVLIAIPKAAGTAGGSIFYKCGSALYKYEPIGETYTGKDGVKKTRTFVLSGYEAFLTKKEHEALYPDVSWADNFNVVTPATHSSEGEATCKCDCGAEWTADDPFTIPKTTDHTYLQKDGKDVVITVAPTCQTEGFQYKVCTQYDGGWDEGEGYYDLRGPDGEWFEINYEDYVDAITAAGCSVPEGSHPVLVGDITPKKSHAFVTWSMEYAPDGYIWDEDIDEEWEIDEVVDCAVFKKCTKCNTTGVYRYTTETVAQAREELQDRFDEMYELVEGNTYKMRMLPLEVEGYVVFSGIKVDHKAGADCSKADTFTFSVNDLDADQKPIPAKTITSALYFGPHNHSDNTATFSKDYKTASITQQCTNKDCAGKLDAEGNGPAKKVDAEVISEDNPDGSTTYTAVLLGLDNIKNNTKTVFDLDKAEVTVNNGEVLNLDEFMTAAMAYADAAGIGYSEAYDLLLKDLVSVTINGIEIDSDLYDIDYWNLAAGMNSIYVEPADGSNAIGEAKGILTCTKPGILVAEDLTLDGKSIKDDEGDEDRDIIYDGDTHVIKASKVYTYKEGPLEVEGAEVKYAVVTEDEYEDPTFSMYDLSYDLDEIELTDAGEYWMFAQVSKDGYTTTIHPLGWFEIESMPVGEVTADAQVIKYGEELEVTTGDYELDEMIGLSGMPASWKGVGTYHLSELVYCDPNYEVDFGDDPVITIEKRNAQIVMKNLTKTWDGKAIAPEKLYTIDGVVNGDDLNVIVNTKGDKKIPTEPGTYTLNATVENNANYNVTVIPGTLKINKKAAKIKKVTPKKKAFKANKKTKKLAKNKTFKLKAKITGEKAKVTFKKANKAGKAKITVSSAGKVTAKKGLAKGTYKVKVKATKAATKHYKKATKTVTVKVVVK